MPDAARHNRSAVTPLRVATGAALALVVAVAMLAATQGGPGFFLQLGHRSHNLAFAQEVLGEDVPVPLEDGHDGENFWVLARDPLLLDDQIADRFDRPLYRAQRVGYPAMAAPWRLAGETALLWGLVLTNVLVTTAGAWSTARLGVLRGRGALVGWAFVFNPLVILAVLFDFSDAAALAAVVVALLAVRTGRGGVLAAAGIVAALSKESSLIMLAAAAVLTPQLSLRRRVQLIVPAGAAALAWRLYVISREGFGTDAQIQEFEAVPFRGFLDAWDRSWSSGGATRDLVVALVGAALAVAVPYLFLRRHRPLELAAALGTCALVPFLSAQVVGLASNSIRAFGPALTLVAISLATESAATPAGSAVQT